MKDILRLLDVYRMAVEHFENCSNDMYLVFKNKTQQLLTKPNVSCCIENEKENNPRIENRSHSFHVTLSMAQ
jgi:hypothetical protein